MCKAPFLVLYVLFILSCNSLNDKKTHGTPLTSEINPIDINNKFLEFYNKLPELQLPFRIICGIEPTDKYSGIENEYVLGFMAIATIKQSADSKRKIILGYKQGEIRYPYIYSFSENGTKLDSIAIHNGNCATDPWIEENCWAEINLFNKITMTDTIRYYFFNDPIRRLDSTIVLIEQISIEPAGKFKTKKLKIDKYY